MDSIGETLRQARTKRGMSLDELATRTRISRRYLEAIETGDRASVPSGFFYKSFVRQYASAVAGGDADLLDRVETLISAEPTLGEHPAHTDVLKVLATRPDMDGPHMGPSLPVATYVVLLILALVACTGVYMWWHHTQQAHAAAQPQPTRSEPVARAQPAATQPEPEQQQPAAEPAAPPQTAAVKPDTSSTESTPPATQGAPTAAITPALPGSAPIVLEITATDTTWVSVAADGKSVFAEVLQPGQTKAFTAQNLARLRIGNAGGLDIKFNGNPAGQIGAKGQVRTVVVTPARLQVLRPSPDEE